MSEVTIKEQNFLLANIYAPNTDEPSFFTEIFRQLDKAETCDKIIGGDFNLVMNTELDRKGSDYNHVKTCDAVHNLTEAYNFIDIWRILNPDKREYTWF